MPYSVKLMSALCAKLDGSRPTIFTHDELVARQFALASILIAGNYLWD
jgi:hypothetical protein